jgi:hypothetical protein
VYLMDFRDLLLSMFADSVAHIDLEPVEPRHNTRTARHFLN